MSSFALKDLGSELNGIITVQPRDIERSIGMPICRICYESEPDNLIEPCNCKGSMGQIHKNCLEHWLSEKTSKKCELCAFEYNVEMVPKYKLLKSIYVWTNEELMQNYSTDVIVIIYWMVILIGAGFFIFPRMYSLEMVNKIKGILSFLILMFIVNSIMIIIRMIYLVVQAYQNWTIWNTLQTNVSLIVK